jgi:hypothetical protein
MAGKMLLQLTPFLVLVVMCVVVPAAGVAWFRHLARRKSRWGINLRPVCEECGAKAPKVRIPEDGQEAMWGGWRCRGCNLRLDKWGRPLPN